MANALELYYAYKFVRLVSKPFTEWKAYKFGIIDDNGDVVRKPDNALEQREWTLLHILARNIKRILAKFPGGRSTIVSTAAAMMLLKEVSDTIPPGTALEIASQFNQLDEVTATEHDGPLTPTINKRYYVDKQLFEGIIDTTGVFELVSEAPTGVRFGEKWYEFIDIVTRRHIELPITLVGELK